MAVHLLVAFLILAMAGHSSAAFCVCKPGVNPGMMQKAIDYACGAGADCNPIRPNGQCYNPNNIVNHCSYAVNSYFQRNAAKGATCVFDGTAALTNQDPSGGGCSYSATSGCKRQEFHVKAARGGDLNMEPNSNEFTVVCDELFSSS